MTQINPTTRELYQKAHSIARTIGANTGRIQKLGRDLETIERRLKGFASL